MLTDDRVAPLPVWGLSVLAAALVVLATRDGAGISWDSITYVQSGINLTDSGRYVGLGGGPITAHPPGLALIAAAFHTIGLAPRSGLRFVNVASAALIVLLSWRLLLRIPAPPTIRLVATAFITVSPVLLAVESMIWSEPIFIVFVLAFLVISGRIIDRRTTDWPSITALSMLCWAAFAVRYSGVVLIPTAIVVLVVARWRPDRRDIARLIAFAALASSVPLVWMLRNRTIDGTFAGPRSPSTVSIGPALGSVVSTLAHWADPATSLTRSGPVLVGTVATIGLLGVIVVAFAVRRNEPSFGRAVTPAAVFIVAYLAQLIAAKVTTFLDPIDTRLLSPIFVPLVVVTTAALEQVATALAPATGTTSASASRNRSRLSLIVTALACLVLVSTLAFTVRDIDRGDIRTLDFNTARWRESDLAAATLVRVDGSNARVMTNAVPGLWVATGLNRIIEMPLAVDWRGEIPTGEAARFARNVNCSPDPLMLALYADGSETTIPVTELETIARLTVVGTYADGALYRVEPRDGVADRSRCPS